MGRSDIYANEFDLDADEFVPMPKGDVHKTKDLVQYVTLYDFDLANSVPQGRGSDMLSFLNQVVKHKKTEITGYFKLCKKIKFKKIFRKIKN